MLDKLESTIKMEAITMVTLGYLNGKLQEVTPSQDRCC